MSTRLATFTLGLVLMLALGVSVGRLAFAAPNLEINYQGKLTGPTNVAVADGSYQMVFRLYSTSTGGAHVWEETRGGADEVTVTGGLFSVLLGSVTPFTGVDFNQTLYLGVTVDIDGEMTPRKKLGTVPAAFEAVNAGTVGGVASTSLIRNDQAGTIATSSAATLLTITQNGAGKVFDLFSGASNVFTVLNNGNVGIGSSTPGSTLTVAGNTFLGGNVTATGTLAISGTSTLATTTISSSTITTLNLINALAGTSGGTGFNTYATGDFLYASGANTLAKRAIGATGNVLSVVGGVPTWSATSTLGFSSSFTTSAGLAALLSDETGSAGGGLAVFSNGPTFTGLTSFASTTNSGTLSVTGTSTFAANVGIGTVSPLALLSVGSINSFTNLSTGMTVRGTANLGTTTGSYTYVTELQNPSPNILRLQFAPYRRINGSSWEGTAWRLQAAVDASFTNGSKSYVEIGTADAATSGGGTIALGTAGNDRLFITDAGNIGIGTTTPANRLTIAGTLATFGTSTLATTTASSLAVGSLSGLLFGTNGLVSAVATSTLGIALSDTTGILAATRGGTGLGTITQNQLLIGGAGNTFTQIATSSLGLSSSFSTSAQLAALLSDESGTGVVAYTINPVFTTPNLGTPSALVGTNITGTASGLTAGTVTTNANLTGMITSVGNAASLGSFTSANLLTAVTDETGTGAAVFANAPTFTGSTNFANTINSGTLSVTGASTFATSSFLGNVQVSTSTFINSTGLSGNGLNFSAGSAGFQGLSGASYTLSILNTGVSAGASTRLLFQSGNTIEMAAIETVNDGGTNNSYMSFANRTVGFVTEKMRLTALGRLGLGTTTPSSLLTLSGVGTTSGLNINNTATINALSGTELGFHFAGADRWKMNATQFYTDTGSAPGLLGSTNVSIAPRYDDLTTGLNWGGTGILGLRAGSSTLNAMTINNGNVGIGTTTPSNRLTVAGTFAALGTSTFATTSVSDLAVSGVFRDSANASGTLGMILQTTGTSTRWVATSTLGITGGITGLGPAGQIQSGPTITQATSTGSFNGLTTNLTINGAANTLTYTPTITGTLNNAGLTNSTIAFATGSTGNDINWSASPVSLGGTATLNIPNASASARGLLTSTDWSTFNGKISSTSLDTSPELAALLTDESGTGVVAYTTSPVFTTPNLGTPSTLVGTNITGTASGLTAGTVTTNANLTGMITSVGNAASLGSFTSANLSTALTNETGTGVAVFSDAPTFTGTTNFANTVNSGTLAITGTSTFSTTTAASSSIGTLTLANALALTSGGTGATTAAGARTNLGATTVGANIFTLANPSTLSFLRINADNTVSAVATSTLGIALSDTTGTLLETRGGTNQTSYATGDFLYASAANTLAKRAIGTTGQVLQVVGGLPTWVATSSLGITGGGASTFLALTDTPSAYTANRIMYTNSGATALVDSANFTFDGSRLSVPGLNVTGTSTFLGTTTLATTSIAGILQMGTTSLASRFNLDVGGFNTAGTAGLNRYYTSTNAASGTVQFGELAYSRLSTTATTTYVGSMFRVEDSTTRGNTVRGLEVQTNRGTNTQGENTALSGFARTFGVRGFTSADAGSVFEPAGGYFETGGTTQGNAIRGYSSTITSAALSSLFQDTSAFSGTGFLMNLGNGTGSFTGNFMDLQVAGISKFSVASTGTAILAGNLLPQTTLTQDIGSSSKRFNNVWAQTVNVGTSTWSIYNGSNGRFAVSDGGEQTGTERFSILTNGNTGIGTSSPLTRLHVWGIGSGLPATTGTAVASGTLSRIETGTSNGVIDFGVAGANTATWIQSSNKTNLATPWRLLLNPNGGDVGIGTSTPGSRLTIVDSDVTNPILSVVASAGTDATVNGKLLELIASEGGGFSFVDSATVGFLPNILLESDETTGFGGVITGAIQTTEDSFSSIGAAVAIVGRRSDSTQLTQSNLLTVRNLSAPVVTISATGTIAQNVIGSLYDVWIQGGAVDAVGGDARNIALIGNATNDELILNFNNEYNCVSVGGTSCSVALSVNGGGLFSNPLYINDVASTTGLYNNPAANNLAASYLSSSGYTSINRTSSNGTFTAETMSIGRSDDGELIGFYSAGSERGAISVTSGTVDYGAFTGSHYGLTNGVLYDMGTVMELTGVNGNYHNDPESEILYGMNKSTVENSSTILGSYLVSFGENESVENPARVMAVGNGAMWVADQGEDIVRGDYLISSDVAGHAEKDTKSYDVSYVIARASEDIDWSTVTTEIGGVKHKLISVFFESFDRPNLDLALFASSTVDLANLSDENPTERFLAGLVDSFVAWFGNAQNGIGSMYANVFNASDRICVDGECLDASDIRDLKNALQNGGSSNPPPQNSGGGSSTGGDGGSGGTGDGSGTGATGDAGGSGSGDTNGGSGTGGDEGSGTGGAGDTPPPPPPPSDGAGDSGGESEPPPPNGG